jgi:hypothetical protein
MGIECGTPPDHLPVESNWAIVPLPQPLPLQWSVKSVPGQTGAGNFIVTGNVAMFRATLPGMVTIRVEGPSGDPAAEFTMEIHEPKMVGLTFAGMRTLIRDDTGAPYESGGPHNPHNLKRHWMPMDDDGDADDPGRVPRA